MTGIGYLANKKTLSGLLKESRQKVTVSIF